MAKDPQRTIAVVEKSVSKGTAGNQRTICALWHDHTIANRFQDCISSTRQQQQEVLQSFHLYLNQQRWLGPGYNPRTHFTLFGNSDH